MIYRLEYLKDIADNNYVGINIYKDVVYPFLNQLREVLGDEYDQYVKYQQDRDRNHHHITVINVMEYNKIGKEMGMDKFVKEIEQIFQYDIDDLKMMGVGTAERSPNRTYFVVVISEKIQAIRSRFGLNPIDLHITLGFKHKDVFGVRKNEVLTIKDPFIKLLKKKYYNDNETFSFIKSIDDYDYDEDDDIEPIKIEDTYATFRVKGDYFSISYIGEIPKFTIVAKWQDKEDKPILSNHLINRKFKEA